jgi:hypothetical protein
MNKSVLNIQIFDVIFNRPTCLGTKFCTRSSVPIGTPTPTKPSDRGDEENVPTEVNQCGGSLYDVLCHIKDSLVSDGLGEDAV